MGNPDGNDICDEEALTISPGRGGLDPFTCSTSVHPYLTRPQRLAITSRAEEIGNLGEVVGVNQKDRLIMLGAILGEIATINVTADPDKLIANIRRALKIVLPSERAGLREVLIGRIKPRIEAGCGVEILHDKKTAQRGDWKVVVGFDGKMFSV